VEYVKSSPADILELTGEIPKTPSPEEIEAAAIQIEKNAEEADLTKASLTELLKDVRLKPPSDYVPSEFALTFVNFIKLVNGAEGEENKTPEIHYYILDGFAGSSDRIAIMVFRGAAKTTLFEYLILFLACGFDLPGIGKINSAIYMSDTIDNGVVNMQKNLEHRHEHSDFLQSQIPKFQAYKVSWEFQNIDGDKFIVKGFGAASGFRGFKVLGKRPKLAMLDDLISDAMAESDVEMAKVEKVIKRGVQPALNPLNQKIIWAGTPFNERDPLCKAVVSGAWEVFMFPVCEQFPCREDQFIGAWDDRFTYSYIKRQYEIAVAGGDTTEFYRELMLQTVSDEEKLIDVETDIQWYDPVILEAYQGNKEVIITTDLSFSGTNTADDAIIDVWEIHPNENVYWVGGMCERPEITDTIDYLFHFVDSFNVQSVGIEISGQQVAMIRLLEKEMMDRNIFFHLAGEKGKSSNQKGIRPVSNKIVRFKSVVPMIKRGKLHFPIHRKNDEIIQDKIHQLDSVTRTGIRSRKDDSADSISMLGLMEINYPSELEENKEDQRNMNLDPRVWGVDPVEETKSYIDNYMV
jgi:hypothetical protein